jgi:hypothetical protein
VLRPLRQGQRFAWLLGGAAGAAGVAGIVLSCLPDLESVPSPRTISSAICGNGIIEGNEECDPGRVDGAAPAGCSRDCKVECDASDGLPTYVDPSSYHCYFQLSKDAGPYEAGSACALSRAHVVTLGSIAEPANISRSLGDLPPFWLGVQQDRIVDGGVRSYTAAVDEPGFTYDGVGCTGCYVVKGGLSPKHSKDSVECVTWSSSRWVATDCDAGFQTLCEREPAGSRWYDCNGLYCFDVRYDVYGTISRTYVWVPDARMSEQGAADYCAALGGDAGTASLVIFETGLEQREQIFYELMHLPRTGDAGPPTDFWIGLTSRSAGMLADGGTKLEWVWDDGSHFGPFQFGANEPTATKTGVRAYASQSSTSYDLPGTMYDTQLVHAHDSANTELHGVLCQIQQ